MEKTSILHPFCFAIYFILNASTTLYRPSVLTILISGLILLIFVYILNVAIGLFVKNNIKCGIITSIISVPILYYPQFIKICEDYCPVLARHRYILLVSFVSVMLLVKLILKTKRKLVTVTHYLNLLSFCFIIYGLLLVWNAGMQGNILRYEDILNSPDLKSQEIAQPEIKKLPDIYYIVLDSYIGSKALKEYLNFSNDDFMSNLEKRGFCVTQDSRAFAAFTRVSIASALDMSDDERLLTAPPDALSKIIKYNFVDKFLKSIGYKTVNLSLFSFSDTPQFYRVFSYSGSSELALIFKNTLLFILAEQIEIRNIYKINLEIFSSLKAMPLSRQGNPRFIYAHLLTPHEPFLFDRNADILPFWDRKRTDDILAYLEQILGTNKLVLDVIDNILLKSVKKPIIIIQGDHGYRYGKHSEQTKLPILNAYYLPGKSCADLWPSISPCNTFRVIFNMYFKTNYKMLEEGS